jgi:hypothetical protein
MTDPTDDNPEAKRAAALARIEAMDPTERIRRLRYAFESVARHVGIDPTRLTDISEHLDSGIEGRVAISYVFDPALTATEQAAFDDLLDRLNRSLGGRPVLRFGGGLPS